MPVSATDALRQQAGKTWFLDLEIGKDIYFRRTDQTDDILPAGAGAGSGSQIKCFSVA